MSVEISKLQKVVDRKDGFNIVNAWITPDNELVITLSHRHTDDHEVIVRVRSEDDVILVDEAHEEWERVHDENSEGYADGPWEDKTTQLGRLNTGGNWEA